MVFSAVANTGRFIASHPLTRDRKLEAFGRLLRWQVEGFLRDAVIFPWIAGTRLLVKRGMSGATGNIYCGLHEFAEMAFVLHLLRTGDLFADVGANIGSYTVLAAGVRRARVVAVEPGSAARAALLDNVALNGLDDLVRVEAVALGASRDRIRFTRGGDTINHVVSGQDRASEEVQQITGDALFRDECPVLMKLDVEGYEAAVLAGAAATLTNPELKALIIELNGSGCRYGFDDVRTHRNLLDLDFVPHDYLPRPRELRGRRAPSGQSTIYVRDLEWVRRRVETAEIVRVLHQEL